MKKKTNQEETEDRSVDRLFSDPLRVSDPAKGLTAWDYFNALDSHVKDPLRVVYLELCELISELPQADMERADRFLTIQRSALMLWEQIDKQVLEDHKVRAGA
jgi:hypothetical protein